MADGASDRFEVLLAETLRSLEESGLKFALKAEQKKAIRHLFERKDVLAVLPTGYGKSLIFKLLVLLAKRAGYSTSLLVITPLVSIINDQIMEVEAMNLTACNLAQKLDSLQDSKEANLRLSKSSMLYLDNTLLCTALRNSSFFSAVGKLQIFFTLHTGRFHYSLVAFCIGRISSHAFAIMRTAACCRRQNIK